MWNFSSESKLWLGRNFLLFLHRKRKWWCWWSEWVRRRDSLDSYVSGFLFLCLTLWCWMCSHANELIQLTNSPQSCACTCDWSQTLNSRWHGLVQWWDPPFIFLFSTGDEGAGRKEEKERKRGRRWRRWTLEWCAKESERRKIFRKEGWRLQERTLDTRFLRWNFPVYKTLVILQCLFLIQ